MFWLTLGEARLDSGGDGHAIDRWRVLASIGAGSIFNVANVLMVYGINLAGLSVAFPLAVGTSLVLGTVLTYFVESADQRPSSPEKLFAGVGLGFAAVVSIALAIICEPKASPRVIWRGQSTRRATATMHRQREPHRLQSLRRCA